MRHYCDWDWNGLLEDFLLLGSVRYHDAVMAALKWCQVDIIDNLMMSGWDRVSFTIYQQCHGDVEGDITPALLQYQNIQWGKSYSGFPVNAEKFLKGTFLRNTSGRPLARNITLLAFCVQKHWEKVFDIFSKHIELSCKFR